MGLLTVVGDIVGPGLAVPVTPLVATGRVSSPTGWGRGRSGGRRRVVSAETMVEGSRPDYVACLAVVSLRRESRLD